MATNLNIAVLDACVLYPAPLRDLLLSLAASGLYQARWTQLIQDEWISNLLANRHATYQQQGLCKTSQLLRRKLDQL
jgi:hypothetical protein